MKAYTKTIFRGFKKNISRFISITLIVFLGVAFVEGLGTLSPTIERSFSEQLNESNVYDLNIKALTNNGISAELINDVKKSKNVSDVMGLTMIESSDSNALTKMLSPNSRAYFLNDDNYSINQLSLVEGRMPSNMNEVAVERSSEYITEYQIGDKVIFTFDAGVYKKTVELEVVGIIANPLIFDTTGELMLTDTQTYLEKIYYLPMIFFNNFSTIGQTLKNSLVTTDLYITFNDTKDLDRFSDNYLNLVSNHKEEIEKLMTYDNSEYTILTLEQTKSYTFLAQYCDKIVIIALIFPLFFILVTALVVLTTMSRMIEEERSMIACQRSLGITDSKIIFKYIFFSLTALFIGSILGLCVGMYSIPAAIFPAFTISFFVPPMSTYVELTYGLISTVFMILVTILVVVSILRKDLKQQPSDLMLPKAPKAGKKIFLEYIPIIWKKLSFKYKSSIRNIFRYKKHLIMTVVSISGSTALVFAGFALMAISQDKTTQHFESIGNTLLPIAFVIIIFAILLSIFVIYNLTNMNIQEREREIATLSVLGYSDLEVASYIFREILTMAIMGILLGVPLGVALVHYVFEYIDFGNISSVSWYYYVATVILIIIFVFVVDLMLYHKIKKVDMTSSLKSVD